MKEFFILGIDLAGVPTRPTGVCFLRGLKAQTSLLYSDEEIGHCVMKELPDLVTIDAPLTLPPGRKSIQDRNGQHFRLCDLELKKRKIPFFPVTLGPMRQLTERGIRLRRYLEERGISVVEIYPGGAQDVLGLPRVKHSLPGLRQGLQRLGIKGLKKDLSPHELDAVTAAYVGLLFLKEKAEIYGDFSTGAIIMPFPSK